MAHTDLSAAFYLLHTTVGDSAMNKFGTRREVFTGRMLLFSVGNDAMKTPRYWQWAQRTHHNVDKWQLSDDVACSQSRYNIGLSKRMRKLSSVFWKSQQKCRLSPWSDEFHSCVGNLFPSCQQLYKSRVLTGWRSGGFIQNPQCLSHL